MSIFYRRELQRFVDEAATFLTVGQLRKLTRAIDRVDDEQSINFEWELVLLVGLNRLGRVVHEPDLAGAAVVDFLFSPPGQTEIVGDFATVSDRGYGKENPVEPFRRELFRRVINKSISPAGFEIENESRTTGPYGAKKIKALVPRASDYRTVFGSEFSVFLDSIKSQPSSVHRFSHKHQDIDRRFVPLPKTNHCFWTG